MMLNNFRNIILILYLLDTHILANAKSEIMQADEFRSVR